MQFFTVILSALALAVSTTTATPLDARATFSLNITAPKEGDKWVAGTKQLVEWDTSNIPKSDKHDLCYIVLGHYDGKSKYEYKDMSELSSPPPVASTDRRSPLLIGKKT
jgi:hypothetical protein